MPDFEYYRRQGLISEAGVIDAGQPHIADAATTFEISGSNDTIADQFTNVSGAMTATASKLNAVIHALEDAGILLTS